MRRTRLLLSVSSGLLLTAAFHATASAADGTAGATGADVTQSAGSDTTRSVSLTVTGGMGGAGGEGTAGATFTGSGTFAGVITGVGTGGTGGAGGIGNANTRSGTTSGSATAFSVGVGGTGGTGGDGGTGLAVSATGTVFTNAGDSTGGAGGMGGVGGGSTATATAITSDYAALANAYAFVNTGTGGAGGSGGAGLVFVGSGGTVVNTGTAAGGAGGAGGVSSGPYMPPPAPQSSAATSVVGPSPQAMATSGYGGASAGSGGAAQMPGESSKAAAASAIGPSSQSDQSYSLFSIGNANSPQVINPIAPAAGAGGSGGVGLVIATGGVTVVNTGAAVGGRGGDGANGGFSTYGVPGDPGGAGGSGGAGIALLEAGSRLTSNGTIQGGNGGLGGVAGQSFGGAPPGQNGAGGAGGVGLLANGATIDNTGLIAGGFANDGAGAQAFAVALASGTNFVGGDGQINGGIDVQGTASFQPALPGSPVGRPLTINGPLSFAQTSTFAVRLTPGASDSAAVTGVATLNGATVQAAVQSGPYTLGARYAVLTATGGVAGRFGALNASFDSLFLTPTLAYDPNDVYLVVSRNGTSFASVGTTPNQRAAATGIEGIGSGPLYTAVLNLNSVVQVRAAFDAASGEIHASATTAGIEGTRLERDAIFDRLDDAARTGGPGALAAVTPFGGLAPALPAGAQGYAPVHKGYDIPAPIPAPPAPAYTVWGSGFGDFGSNGGNGNAATLDRSLGGFVAGVDTRVDWTWLSNWRIGVAGGFTHDDLTIRDRASSGSFETYFGGLYAGAQYGAFDVKLGALGGGTGTETRRTVTFPGFSDATRVGYDGTIAQGFGEIGYKIGLPRGFIEPLVQGAAIHIGQDGFREDGGAAALVGRSRDTDVQTTTVGLKAEGAIPFGGLPLIARAFVGYRHAFGDVDPRVVEQFAAGGPAFTIAGAPIDRDAVVADIGLDYRLSQAVTLGISYDGQAGRRADDNAVRGTLRVKF